MNKFIVVACIAILSALAGGVAGYELKPTRIVTASTTTTTVNTVCVSIEKETRKLIDYYKFLLARTEIQEEEKRSIEREYYDKFATLIQTADKKGCR